MQTIAVRRLGRQRLDRVVRHLVLVQGVVRRRLFSSSIHEAGQATNKLRPSRWTKATLVVLGGCAFGAYKSVVVVETGQVAVVDILGVLQDDVLESGLHLVQPWAKVTTFNVQTQQVSVPTKTRIRGGLFVELELLVHYRLDATKIKDIYLARGTQENWHVEAIARSVLHSVVAKKSMEQIHDTQQLAIGQEIKTKLNELYKSQGVVVQAVVLQKVQLPDYLVQAIQDLHVLDLEISQDKRVVDGQLAVARGTAAARSALNNNNNKAKGGELPEMYKSAMEHVKKNPAVKLPKVTKTEKPLSLRRQDEPKKEKSIAQRVFPYFFDNEDKQAKKNLVVLKKGDAKKDKENEKIVQSIWPYSLFAATEEKEEEARVFEDSSNEKRKQQPAKEKAVLSEKKNDNKTAVVTKAVPTASEEAKVVEKVVAEAKVPPLKADSATNVKPELPKNPTPTNAEPAALQETTTTNKAKAAGETEKES